MLDPYEMKYVRGGRRDVAYDDPSPEAVEICEILHKLLEEGEKNGQTKTDILDNCTSGMDYERCY